MDLKNSLSKSGTKSGTFKAAAEEEDISIEDIDLKMPKALPAKLTYSENIAKKMSKIFQMHQHIKPFVGCFYFTNLFYLYLFKKYKVGCILTDYGNGMEFVFSFQNNKSVSLHKNYIESSAEKIFRCIMRGEKIIIIPFMMKIIYNDQPVGAHANLLIYRRNTGQLEHFEPHGAEYGGIKKIMVDNQRDKVLSKIVKAINVLIDYETNGNIPFVTLLKSHDVCPNIRGLQSLEQESTIPKTVIEPIGYCVAWSMFFAELCLKNPEIPSRQIFEAIMEKTELYDNKNDYLRNIIRGYTCFINNKIAKHFSSVFGEPMSSEKIHSMIERYKREGINEEIIDYGDKLSEIMEVEMVNTLTKNKDFPEVRDKYIEFSRAIETATSSSSLKSEGRLSPLRSRVKSHSSNKMPSSMLKTVPSHDEDVVFKTTITPRTPPSSSKKNDSGIKDSMAKGLKGRTMKNRNKNRNRNKNKK